MNTGQRSVEEVPEFLQGTIAMSHHRSLVGEWTLDVPLSRYGSSPRWVDSFIRDFVAAFPWLKIARLKLSLEGSNGWPVWPTGLEPDPRGWLEQHLEGASHCYGFETVLEADLHWRAPAGLSGVSRIPGAFRLIVNGDDDGLNCILTLWINLFTDQVHLYRRLGSNQWEMTLVSFDGAAAANRRLLSDSLRRWKSLTAGEYSPPESEVVLGITLDGFSADSSPIAEA